MAKAKFDGVVEAVHYQPDGQVAWVRAYVRRGATFSDHVLLDRQAIIELLKSGKRYLSGQRVPLRASTFETGDALRVLQKNDREVLVVGEIETDRDRLEGVPII
ncbi:MAG: hypothetical protein AB1894_22225 [Chloroflexota bacterium]